MGKAKSAHQMICQCLRTPLARMRLSLEMLKDKAPDDEENESVEHLRDMETEIEELDSLIGNILELSKLDIQETASASELFSPASALESVLQKFEPLMKSKNIALRSSFNSRTEIFGNQSAFVSALSNIVDNARKFSPVNGTVEASVEEEDGLLLVAVSNAAAELSAEESEKIFEPFYRVNPGREEGTGLGLAIAKKIIEQRGGKISAATARGRITIKMKIPTRLQG